jgi:aspartate racemase
MFRTVEALYRSAQVVGKELVVGIPCNTFHAPRIFGPFREKVARAFPEMQLLHMLEETGRFLKDHYPHLQTIGLMTTTGTREVQVYRKILKPLGVELTRVPQHMQKALNTTIYHPKWGLKAVTPASPEAKTRFQSYARVLIEQGAEAIILGCTEIPLALPEPTLDGIPLIDPVEMLAKALIREALGDVQ